MKAFNEEQDYIKGHDLGREILLQGEHKKMAKLMAWPHMPEMPEHSFDESDFLGQLQNLDRVIQDESGESFIWKIRLKNQE